MSYGAVAIPFSVIIPEINSGGVISMYDEIDIVKETILKLKKKLQKCGFRVFVSRPTGVGYFYPPSALKIHVGYLYAENCGNKIKI